ncbi:MAG: AroM family protein [Firmicutes bacterium]|nr:AroM family protein [Bacillota bacterium]
MTEKKIIGLLTIGQSPRPDMTADLNPIFEGKAEYIEAGALDGLTKNQVESMKPEPGEHFLVTRLADGSMVTLAARHLSDLMQQQVSRLEAKGASALMILCTEAFQPFDCSIPVIYPNDVLKVLVPIAAPDGHIGVILPEAGQMEDFAEVWKQVVPNVTAAHGSPYAGDGSLEHAAKSFAHTDVGLIVLDCMGYSSGQQELVSELSGKPVLLSRTLAAKVLMELI